MAGQVFVRLQSDSRGVLEVPGIPDPHIVIHAGKPVRISCDREGRRHSGLAVHGDIDIVPAGVPARWELGERDTALLLAVPQSHLRDAAEEAGWDESRVELVNRFQARDPEIERIGWAMLRERERGYPRGALYTEELSTALASHLLRWHGVWSREGEQRSGGLSGYRLKQVLAYIEENLGGELPLRQVARVAGIGVTQCKTAFRQSVGMPVHQYVIGRRVERARMLLRESEMPISQIAEELGFSHQSHLAHHVRRVLGDSPRGIRAAVRKPADSARR